MEPSGVRGVSMEEQWENVEGIEYIPDEQLHVHVKRGSKRVEMIQG